MICIESVFFVAKMFIEGVSGSGPERTWFWLSKENPPLMLPCNPVTQGVANLQAMCNIIFCMRGGLTCWMNQLSVQPREL